MAENIEEYIPTQIYQSFTNNNIENSQNINFSSIKKESEEFTFKKIISDSNKSTETEKEQEQDIYSKNDENIQQSGHFYNEKKEDLKNKELAKNIKGKNNMLKPLLKFIAKKKLKFQKLKLNKINTIFLFRKNLDATKNSKRNLIYCNYFKNHLKLNINKNLSNINTKNNKNNNNNKCLISYISKYPINTFLEISHDSYNEKNENKKANENKENFNTTNAALIKKK